MFDRFVQIKIVVRVEQVLRLLDSTRRSMNSTLQALVFIGGCTNVEHVRESVQAGLNRALDRPLTNDEAVQWHLRHSEYLLRQRAAEDTPNEESLSSEDEPLEDEPDESEQ